MALTSEILINRPDRPGTLRIREKHTDSLGRVYTKSYNVENTADVNALLAQHAAEFQELISNRDAKEFVDQGSPITADYKEASIKLIALNFLRRALKKEDPYIAYLRFDRFNDYRLAQGWTINQVVTQLSSVGLTAEEWEKMKTRYQYLSTVENVDLMDNYQMFIQDDPYYD